MSDNNLQRGNTWSLMETFCLIQCWADDAIEAEVSGTHRNRHVYEKISYKMKEHGYVRNWDACRTKVKALRVQYMKAKQQNNTSGHERAKFAYFDEIDKFMGTRPIVQPELVVNAGAEYLNVDDLEISKENESAEIETSQNFKDEIDANVGQLAKEKEQKMEINQKKPISRSRKRKRDKTFGPFMETLTQMELSSIKLFLEQEEKIRKEEHIIEEQRLQLERQFQMQMFAMQQKPQMQMMIMFGQQISSAFTCNDSQPTTSGKPAADCSGDASGYCRQEPNFFEMQDAFDCLDTYTYTNL